VDDAAHAVSHLSLIAKQKGETMTTHTQLLHGSREATQATFRAAQRPERVINHVTRAKRGDRRQHLILTAVTVGVPLIGGVAYLLS
jgi:hypothetical protein